MTVDVRDNGHAQEFTQEELEAFAEETAREMLGVSFPEAVKRLDRGELRGSIAGAEIEMLRDLIES